MTDLSNGSGLSLSLLDDPLIRYRRVTDGAVVQATLPDLLIALAQDDVRDFSALRPHQRHPWHAFLVQLAAIALHRAGRDAPFESVQDWRDALLALTPDDPDGAAWCLVAPVARPAFLQPPVPEGRIDDWKNVYQAADELDMLVTSKNHDVKGARATKARPEDWLFALLSLQTQEGFLGAGNYGISRMNGGFASRPGVGLSAPGGRLGQRWASDLDVLRQHRDFIAKERGLSPEEGIALVWSRPWNGLDSLSFAALDPFYIELCRRVRLILQGANLCAIATGTKAPRIAAKELNGVTGDPWVPVETDAAKALTITSKGFDYKLIAELLFGTKYTAAITQDFSIAYPQGGAVLIAQGVTRGQGKTEGYHERRVPVSPKARSLLIGQQKSILGKVASRRIVLINEVRLILCAGLLHLFNNGVPGKEDKKLYDKYRNKIDHYSAVFEQGEDARFFLDLNEEIESEDQANQHLQWQLGMVDRAEAVLRQAFVAGPRSAIQRYRAQAAALSRFHGTLKGLKSPLPEFLQHHKEAAKAKKEEEHDIG
jgi:CRISPR system Cascade subunit CasA